MQRIEKPWGHELIWAHTARYVGKVLHIRGGESLSLQYHVKKEETILVQSGKLRLVLGETEHVLEPGQQAHILPGTVHRMEAVETCDIVEVSTPELEDVVRLEDRYGRTTPPGELKEAA
jgi:quercetin dioxygenase-like cupin family protein